MDTTLFARQPIFDRHSKVFGYELLFRNQTGKAGLVTDSGDYESTQVLANALLGPNNQWLSGKKAFINFTRNLLDQVPDFAKGTLVVEILEDVHTDPDLPLLISDLKRRGHIIALDDFKMVENGDKLIQLADIVKIDILEDHDNLPELLDTLKSKNVQILAEKVETREQYRQYLDLGFDLFQGYFFAEPETIKSSPISSNQKVAMDLLSALYQDVDDWDEIVQLIEKDPTISVKLLQLINSPFFRRQAEISTIRQAVVAIGFHRLRSWASLLILSDLGTLPTEILRESLFHSEFCRLVAQEIGEDQDMAGTVGLFSNLDAFFNRALPELLSTLGLEQHVKEAILNFEGSLGEVLKTSIQYSRGDWEKLNFQSLQAIGVDLDSLIKAYDAALAETDNNMEELVKA